MRRPLLFFIVAQLSVLLLSMNAWADDDKEIESITVFADKRLSIPLAQLASQFSTQSTISVSDIFGSSQDQKKKIEDGEAADIFITSEPELIQQLKIKGMVDVYSIGEIAVLDSTHFDAAVVAGENMTPARAFLEFLKSPDAQKLLRQNAPAAP